MELADILGGLLSAGTGSIFGLLGSVVGVVGKYLQRKQQAVEEDKERQHELALLKLQQQNRNAETENELAIANQEADAAIREGSYNVAVTVSSVHMWVNDVRALFRPFITLSLVAASMVVLYWMLESFSDGGPLAGVMDPTESIDLIRYMVYSLFFSMSTALVWWFGDRALTPPAMKNR